MAPSLVTLVLDVYNGAAEQVTSGYAVLAPSVQLTDAADQMLVVPDPITGAFHVGPIPEVELIPTSNTDFLPAGWAWTITFAGVPGRQGFSFFLDEAGGSTQYLSDLTPVFDVTTMAAYLPLDGGTLRGALVPAVAVLEDAATIAVNARLANHFRVTLGGNRTLGTPSSPGDGQKMIVEVVQDGTGGRTLAYSAGYSFLPGLPQPTLTSAAGARNFLGFTYNAVTGLWYCLAFI